MDEETPKQNRPAEGTQHSEVGSSANQNFQINADNKAESSQVQGNHTKVKVGLAKAILAVIAGLFAGGIIFATAIFFTSPNQVSFKDFINSLLLSLAVGIVAFVAVIVLLVKVFNRKATVTIKLVIGGIFLVIFASVTARTLVVHSNNKIHAKEIAEAPLIVQATYVQTANKDADIIVSNVSGALMYKQKRDANTGLGSNEVNTLYCFTTPNSSSPNLVSELTSGLNRVPVVKAGASFTYIGSTTLPDGGSVPLTPGDISALQIQLNHNDQIDMPFNISNQGSSSGDILALKTSNRNYYPQANVDIKINNPSQTGRCISMASKTNAANKLIISLDLDLADDPDRWSAF